MTMIKMLQTKSTGEHFVAWRQGSDWVLAGPLDEPTRRLCQSAFDDGYPRDIIGEISDSLPGEIVDQLPPELEMIDAKAVRQALREHAYDTYGLRRLSYLPEGPDGLGPSQVLSRERRPAEGTSAMWLRDGDTPRHGLDGLSVEQALAWLGGYDGEYVVLLGANSCVGGADESELVMVDPVVLERWYIA